MNGKQRLLALLHGDPVDHLAWTTLVDRATLDLMPPELAGNGGLDLYRHLGCDILLLDTWGLPYGLRSPRLVWSPGVDVNTETHGDTSVTTWDTSRGSLQAVSKRSHPVRYPVTTLEEVRLYRWMWENAHYVDYDDSETLRLALQAVGDDGIITRYWGPSSIPHLLETAMGTEAFYLLQNDYPDEMDGLINAIHRCQLEAFRLLASGTVETVILCENTSSYFISPWLYRQYNGPHVADFCRIIRAAGKTALVHMCGHILNLLPDIASTGLQGVHGLTPPPVGNTPYERYLDEVGSDQVVIGVFEPSVFNAGTRDDIWRELDALYTPRIRSSRFILWAAADGLPVDLWRFKAISDWMRQNGSA